MAALQTGVLQKLRRVLRLLDGNGHHFRVAPMKLRHALGGVETVHTLRVEEIQEDPAMFQRVRLAVHRDGLRRLHAGLPDGGRSVGNQREYHHRAQHQNGASGGLPAAATRFPPTPPAAA